MEINYKLYEHPTSIKMTQVEILTFQLKYILSEYGLNNTELQVLSYIHLYGQEGMNKAVEEKVSKRYKSIENIVSSMRGQGFIHGRGKLTALHPEIKLIVKENIKFVIKLELA